jgi:hypothetical protein
MGGQETNTKRTTDAAQGATTKGVMNVRIFFQRFAGTHGADADRGVGGVEYELIVNGADPVKGKTSATGAITFPMPDEATVQIKVFGTTYDIKRLAGVGDRNKLVGIQRRLQVLGYEPGAKIDGADSRAFDVALSNFAADQQLLPIGLANATIDPPADGRSASLSPRHGIAKAGDAAHRDKIVAEANKTK